MGSGAHTHSRRVLATAGSLLAVLAGCSAITDFKGLAGDPSTGGASDAGTDEASVADSASTVDAGGLDAAPLLPTSCQTGGNGASATCGASKAADCCTVTDVPGGTFNRSNDSSYPATVSSFRLDRFETTNGRFRKFVSAGFGTAQSPPASGSGAHPKIAGSGWDSAWNKKLPATTSDLLTRLHCGNSHWTDSPDAYESYSIGCLDWYLAFAFCAWDGGRLPTEAEWNYAAAGGNEQRNYPWTAKGQPQDTIDPTYATYGCYGHGGAPPYNEAGIICVPNDILAVGIHSPKGDGKWGHADLAGSMWEWTLDAYVSPYASSTCVDCANTAWDQSSYRVIRGGDYDSTPSSVTTANRGDDTPANYGDDRGIRCARDP